MAATSLEKTLEAERQALVAEHEALKREHADLCSKLHDIEVHQAHRLRLLAHMDRLHAFIDRLDPRPKARRSRLRPV